MGSFCFSILILIQLLTYTLITRIASNIFFKFINDSLLNFFIFLLTGYVPAGKVLATVSVL